MRREVGVIISPEKRVRKKRKSFGTIGVIVSPERRRW